MKSFHDVDRQPRILPATIAARPQEQLGAELKSMFEGLTAGPMPDRLLQLADALEEAFQRGELFETRPSHDA
jgi:hypothetical protein